MNPAHSPASPSLSPSPPPSPETQEATGAKAAKADGTETDGGQTEGDQTPLLFSGLTVERGLSELDLLLPGSKTEELPTPYGNLRGSTRQARQLVPERR